MLFILIYLGLFNYNFKKSIIIILLGLLLLLLLSCLIKFCIPISSYIFIPSWMGVFIVQAQYLIFELFVLVVYTSVDSLSIFTVLYYVKVIYCLFLLFILFICSGHIWNLCFWHKINIQFIHSFFLYYKSECFSHIFLYWLINLSCCFLFFKNTKK